MVIPTAMCCLLCYVLHTYVLHAKLLQCLKVTKRWLAVDMVLVIVE
jgi:hypothetical protein